MSSYLWWSSSTITPNLNLWTEGVHWWVTFLYRSNRRIIHDYLVFVDHLLLPKDHTQLYCLCGSCLSHWSNFSWIHVAWLASGIISMLGLGVKRVAGGVTLLQTHGFEIGWQWSCCTRPQQSIVWCCALFLLLDGPSLSCRMFRTHWLLVVLDVGP